MARPLLLIDVDGVISLFGFDPGRRPAGRFEMVDGIAHFLLATAGQHLRRHRGALSEYVGPSSAGSVDTARPRDGLEETFHAPFMACP